MKTLITRIGSHHLQISANSNHLWGIITNNFESIDKFDCQPDMTLSIIEGFGSPFEDFHVSITKDAKKVYFRRSDYLIESDLEYKNAVIFVRDELALKHALTNIYSSFIVFHNWGLLIHSSCVIEDGKAHVFAGQSGAGKSTAAILSQPRDLLSDEATLVHITANEIKVFNSPFRSELKATSSEESVPLTSIQFLNQALQNKRVNIRKSDALVQLLEKVFYWAHNPEETKNIMGLLSVLVDKVPAYELYFKKDDTFWELIS